jgi:hypothetical protein
MDIRNPSVAGQFYEGTKAGLRSELSRLVEKGAKKEDCLGIISPHAGYIYSGAVAGKVISRVAFKDTFIILGPNHTGLGSPFSIMARGAWRTPMGDVEIDNELASRIMDGSSRVKEDPSAHLYEHSIEVQLPFLQYLGKDFKFVPMVVSAADTGVLRKLGKGLASAIKGSGKKVVMISSSDMTHYESRDSAREKDGMAIDAILKLDEDALVNKVSEHNITMCGYAPTVVMIAALKELGAKEARLVDYKTSGDASGDYSSVVGYAGIIIK